MVFGIEADTDLIGSDGNGVVLGPLSRCSNAECRSWYVEQL